MKQAEPNIGATRVVKRFLLLPHILPYADEPNARKVRRWLEIAEIKQIYEERKGIDYEWHLTGGQWEDVAWNDLSRAQVSFLGVGAAWEDGERV